MVLSDYPRTVQAEWRLRYLWPVVESEASGYPSERTPAILHMQIKTRTATEGSGGGSHWPLHPP
jgi:hypothetical protein